MLYLHSLSILLPMSYLMLSGIHSLMLLVFLHLSITQMYIMISPVLVTLHMLDHMLLSYLLDLLLLSLMH